MHRRERSHARSNHSSARGEARSLIPLPSQRPHVLKEDERPPPYPTRSSHSPARSLPRGLPSLTDVFGSSPTRHPEGSSAQTVISTSSPAGTGHLSTGSTPTQQTVVSPQRGTASSSLQRFQTRGEALPNGAQSRQPEWRAKRPEAVAAPSVLEAVRRPREPEGRHGASLGREGKPPAVDTTFIQGIELEFDSDVLDATDAAFGQSGSYGRRGDDDGHAGTRNQEERFEGEYTRLVFSDSGEPSFATAGEEAEGSLNDALTGATPDDVTVGRHRSQVPGKRFPARAGSNLNNFTLGTFCGPDEPEEQSNEPCGATHNGDTAVGMAKEASHTKLFVPHSAQQSPHNHKPTVSAPPPKEPLSFLATAGGASQIGLSPSAFNLLLTGSHRQLTQALLYDSPSNTLGSPNFNDTLGQRGSTTQGRLTPPYAQRGAEDGSPGEGTSQSGLPSIVTANGIRDLKATLQSMPSSTFGGTGGARLREAGARAAAAETGNAASLGPPAATAANVLHAHAGQSDVFKSRHGPLPALPLRTHAALARLYNTASEERPSVSPSNTTTRRSVSGQSAPADLSGRLAYPFADVGGLGAKHGSSKAASTNPEEDMNLDSCSSVDDLYDDADFATGPVAGNAMIRLPNPISAYEPLTVATVARRFGPSALLSAEVGMEDEGGATGGPHGLSATRQAMRAQLAHCSICSLCSPNASRGSAASNQQHSPPSQALTQTSAAAVAAAKGAQSKAVGAAARGRAPPAEKESDEARRRANVASYLSLLHTPDTVVAQRTADMATPAQPRISLRKTKKLQHSASPQDATGRGAGVDVTSVKGHGVVQRAIDSRHAFLEHLAHQRPAEEKMLNKVRQWCDRVRLVPVPTPDDEMADYRGEPYGGFAKDSSSVAMYGTQGEAFLNAPLPMDVFQELELAAVDGDSAEPGKEASRKAPRRRPRPLTPLYEEDPAEAHERLMQEAQEDEHAVRRRNTLARQKRMDVLLRSQQEEPDMPQRQAATSISRASTMLSRRVSPARTSTPHGASFSPPMTDGADIMVGANGMLLGHHDLCDRFDPFGVRETAPNEDAQACEGGSAAQVQVPSVTPRGSTDQRGMSEDEITRRSVRPSLRRLLKRRSADRSLSPTSMSPQNAPAHDEILSLPPPPLPAKVLDTSVLPPEARSGKVQGRQRIASIKSDTDNVPVVFAGKRGSENIGGSSSLLLGAENSPTSQDLERAFVLNPLQTQRATPSGEVHGEEKPPRFLVGSREGRRSNPWKRNSDSGAMQSMTGNLLASRSTLATGQSIAAKSALTPIEKDLLDFLRLTVMLADGQGNATALWNYLLKPRPTMAGKTQGNEGGDYAATGHHQRPAPSPFRAGDKGDNDAEVASSKTQGFVKQDERKEIQGDCNHDSNSYYCPTAHTPLFPPQLTSPPPTAPSGSDVVDNDEGGGGQGKDGDPLHGSFDCSRRDLAGKPHDSAFVSPVEEPFTRAASAATEAPPPAPQPTHSASETATETARARVSSPHQARRLSTRAQLLAEDEHTSLIEVMDPVTNFNEKSDTSLMEETHTKDEETSRDENHRLGSVTTASPTVEGTVGRCRTKDPHHTRDHGTPSIVVLPGPRSSVSAVATGGHHTDDGEDRHADEQMADLYLEGDFEAKTLCQLQEAHAILARFLDRSHLTPPLQGETGQRVSAVSSSSVFGSPAQDVQRVPFLEEGDGANGGLFPPALPLILQVRLLLLEEDDKRVSLLLPGVAREFALRVDAVDVVRQLPLKALRFLMSHVQQEHPYTRNGAQSRRGIASTVLATSAASVGLAGMSTGFPSMSASKRMGASAVTGVGPLSGLRSFRQRSNVFGESTAHGGHGNTAATDLPGWVRGQWRRALQSIVAAKCGAVLDGGVRSARTDEPQSSNVFGNRKAHAASQQILDTAENDGAAATQELHAFLSSASVAHEYQLMSFAVDASFAVRLSAWRSRYMKAATDTWCRAVNNRYVATMAIQRMRVGPLLSGAGVGKVGHHSNLTGDSASGHHVSFSRSLSHPHALEQRQQAASSFLAGQHGARTSPPLPRGSRKSGDGATAVTSVVPGEASTAKVEGAAVRAMVGWGATPGVATPLLLREPCRTSSPSLGQSTPRSLSPVTVGSADGISMLTAGHPSCSKNETVRHGSSVTAVSGALAGVPSATLSPNETASAARGKESSITIPIAATGAASSPCTAKNSLLSHPRTTMRQDSHADSAATAEGPPFTFNGIPFAPTSAANGGAGGRSCYPLDMRNLYVAASLAAEETMSVLIPRLQRIRESYHTEWTRARAAAAALPTEPPRPPPAMSVAAGRSKEPPLSTPNTDVPALVTAFDAWQLLQPLLALETEYAATLHDIYAHEQTIQRFNVNVDAFNAHQEREQRLWGPVYRSGLAISYLLCMYLRTHGLEEMPEHYLALLHPVALFVGCPGGHRELRAKLKEVLVDVAERAKKVQVHVEVLPETLLDDAAMAVAMGKEQQQQQLAQRRESAAGGGGDTAGEPGVYPAYQASDIVCCLATEADVLDVRLTTVDLPATRIFELPALSDGLSMDLGLPS